MEHRNGEPETSQEAPEESSGKAGIGERFRASIRSAGESVTGTADTITGVQFRRQFEDFTDAVTTAVVGVHCRTNGKHCAGAIGGVDLMQVVKNQHYPGDCRVNADDTAQQLAAS